MASEKSNVQEPVEIWYQACCRKISEAVVVSHTKKFVVVRTKNSFDDKFSTIRHAKSSDWYWIRQTREEAKSAMLESARKKYKDHLDSSARTTAQLEADIEAIEKL